MSACAHKEDHITLASTVAIPIDESKIVLLRSPQKLKSINDSIIGCVNSSQTLSLYSLKTGYNKANFTLNKFNFDSLVNETYVKKYGYIKQIKYQKDFELNGTNYQLVNFYNEGNSFYIQVSLMAETEDFSDSLMAIRTRSLPDSLKKKNARIIMMDYLNFIFVTSIDFKIEEIIPLYAESSIKSQGYYPYYHKNFLIDNNLIYLAVARNEASPNLEAKINNDPSNFCLAKFNLKKQDETFFQISYKESDFSDFRLQDYITTSFNYSVNNNVKLLSTAKEIISLEDNRKILPKNTLESNEWIEDFYSKSDQELILVTSKKDKTNSVVISGQVCPVDTITEKNLKIFDIKNKAWLGDKKLPVGQKTICLTSNKVIFISKDEKSYYINYITYNEN
jgi:hypothetical protein